MTTTPSKSQRWRCLTVGCNPKLRLHNAQQHAEQTGHRVARWPVRSAAGRAAQRARGRQSSPNALGRDDEAMAEYEDAKDHS